MYRTREMEFRQRAKQTFTLEAAALTQQGERRPVNQDVVFHHNGRAEAGLYMVCDGLGGHPMGEVASRLAVDTVAAELTSLFSDGASAWSQRRTLPSPSMLDEWIRLAIVTANIRIRRYAESHWHQAGNLGSTITLDHHLSSDLWLDCPHRERGGQPDVCRPRRSGDPGDAGSFYGRETR